MCGTEIYPIVGKVEEAQEFVTLEDGFVYFWPSRPPRYNGALSAWHLRLIADELDKRNAPLQAEIDKYFSEHL